MKVSHIMFKLSSILSMIDCFESIYHIKFCVLVCCIGNGLLHLKYHLPVPRTVAPPVNHELPASGRLNLPDFNKSDFQNIILIGQGSFGKVFRAVRNRSPFVIKEMTDPHSSVEDKRLFLKEAD
jgi:hypothetical protein